MPALNCFVCLLISPTSNATFFQERLAGCLLERVECFPMLPISESPSLLRLKTIQPQRLVQGLKMKDTNSMKVKKRLQSFQVKRLFIVTQVRYPNS